MFILNDIPMLIFACIVFEGLQCTQPFRKTSGGTWVSYHFLGNNRQHMPVCAKPIFFFGMEVADIAKPYMSQGAYKGAAASVALVAGVFLVSILQAGS